MLPDLLTAPDTPDLLGSDDTVRVVRLGADAGVAADGWPDEAAAETVVYDGPADVQDAGDVLDDEDGVAHGEHARRRAALFLTGPDAASAVADARVGDTAETPLGSGRVATVRALDLCLVVDLLDRPAE